MKSALNPHNSEDHTPTPPAEVNALSIHVLLDPRTSPVVKNIVLSSDVYPSYSVSTQRVDATHEVRLRQADCLIAHHDTYAQLRAGGHAFDPYLPEQIICLAEQRCAATKQLTRQGVTVVYAPYSTDDILTEAALVGPESRTDTAPAPAPAESRGKHKVAEHIVFSSSDRYTMVAPADIIAMRSSGNYTTVYLREEKPITVSKQLGQLEEQLDPAAFFRIHHSYIINKAHIKMVRKDGQLAVELNGCVVAPVSRRRRTPFLAWLGLKK